jgi:hypothetical protein
MGTATLHAHRRIPLGRGCYGFTFGHWARVVCSIQDSTPEQTFRLYIRYWSYVYSGYSDRSIFLVYYFCCVGDNFWTDLERSFGRGSCPRSFRANIGSDQKWLSVVTNFDLLNLRCFSRRCIVKSFNSTLSISCSLFSRGLKPVLSEVQLSRMSYFITSH